MLRLQKFLAHAGIASRRKCEEYILEGKVKVNGEVIRTLGTVVMPGDEVWFENRRVAVEEELVYYLLNKPIGYITSVQDENNRATVVELLRDVKERIFPVGRLDYNTSGLLIMTNDGALTYSLTHPKHIVNKTYTAKVRGHVSEQSIKKLCDGVVIDGRMTAPALVTIIKEGATNTTLSITIHEGRNRQVRKMCMAVGHDVINLKRTAIGRLRLGELQVGEYRALTKDEIHYLKRLGEVNA
ncbi:MAG: pseudouridine synthase [Cellulosilyticaceae bacterium]